jgi:hypothetical protein
MEIKLQAFKALAMRHADQVKATSGLQGYGLSVGGDTLHTDSNKPRVFSNLNTLANFARSIGLKSITVDLSQEPAAKPKAKKAAATAKPAAKPRPAQKAKAAA